MPRPLSYVFASLIVALLIGGPVAYAYFQQGQLRNFHEVKEGVLYRSGQLPLSGLKRVLHDYGIKTVVTLREDEKAKWAAVLRQTGERLAQRTFAPELLARLVKLSAG